MNKLRAATAAEIEKIREHADLDPTCMVIALDTPQGAIVGVIRRPVELDPVFFPPELANKYKVIFARDVATGLMFQGATHFYFNIAADDAAWQQAVEGFGAEQVSPHPELRYKLTVYEAPNGNQENNKDNAGLQQA